jgi:sugar lactone lactonase YvrE
MFSALALSASVFLCDSAKANTGSIPRYPDIMPLSQVKAGMHGYGLTVFRGTKIERFDVAIVGVVKKGSLAVPGRDMILVRMSGGPMTKRHAYLIRGMSGSPVYVNGKIIGAFSQGEPTTKEALGGVTPIEDMLEAWDPRLPDAPLARDEVSRSIETTVLPQPLRIAGRIIRKIVSNAPLKSELRSHGETLVLHPCTTFATFNSPSRSAREKLAKALEPYNVELVKGGAAAADANFKGAPLVAGSAFAMMLVTGDMSLGATGTVTYRRENRILGFGHRFMNIGAIDAPLCSSYIYDIYPLSDGSYKISSFGPVVGTSAQDTLFAISGTIGKKPKTIPVTVDVRDKTTGKSRVFRAETSTHPNLYAALVSSTVGAAISEIRSTPGAAMATVTTTVDAEEVGKISRTNICFDSRGIDGAATADLDDFLSILTSNPFYPVGLKSANVKVEIESGRKTAQVERIFLKEGKFEPGETAQIGIVIKPYKQPSFTRIVPLKLPQNTPSGRYVLQVRGGAVPPGINFGGMILRPGGGQNPDQAPPASIRQMVSRYEEKEKQNDVVVRLQLLSTSVNVDGERLSNLPPSLDALMRSSKTSGVRLERDELKVVEPTDWVLSGQQAVAFTVQRKDNQEGAAPSGGAPGFQPQGGAPSFVQNGSAGSEGLTSVPGGIPNEPDEDLAVIGGSLASDDKKKPESTKAKQAQSKSEPSAAKPEDVAPAKEEQKAPAAVVQPVNDQPTTEKPVGRQPVIWRQTSRADFAKGELQGVAVTTGGDLVLTRTLKPLLSSTESFVWSMVPDKQGGVYAGTGTQGAILHVGADGKSTTLARLPEISVHGLILQSDGSLLAGTGPHGRIYRVKPDGKFELVHESSEKYVLALVQGPQGQVYAATGGNTGRILKVDENGKTTELFKTTEEHVLSLAVDKDGSILAGTSPNGIVYRVSPDGKASVLYDAAEPSITGVAVNSAGQIYAVTAPRAVIYKINPDGSAKTLFDKAPNAYTSLRPAPNDTIFAAAGSAVYAIRPDDTIAIVDNKSDVDFLSIATAADGRLYVGTGNVAEIFSSAPPNGHRDGVFVSVVHDAKQVSRWGTIRWTSSAPSGTKLTVATRTGNVSEPDTSWSGWATTTSGSDGAQIGSPAARYIQYRIAMEGDATTSPTLRDVALTYLPRNQAPKVAFQVPAGGERWAGKQTLKWEGSDPDKDTLSYEVYYSADGGLSWLPLPTEVKPTVAQPQDPKAILPSKDPTAAPGSAEAKQPLGSGPPSVASVKSELDKHPELPAAMREAILNRAIQVNASGSGLPAQGVSSIGSGPQKEATRVLNTRLLPDGNYMFKVVASDRASNPTESLSSDAVSEPILVCNATPSLMLFKDAIAVENGTFTIRGSAVQPKIALTGVQYRVDGGEWSAAVAQDGIFDTSTELFALSAGKLSAGRHTIEVKAFNSAGLTATDKVEIEVK